MNLLDSVGQGLLHATWKAENYAIKGEVHQILAGNVNDIKYSKKNQISVFVGDNGQRLPKNFRCCLS